MKYLWWEICFLWSAIQLFFYSFKMVGLTTIMWELYIMGDYNWFECAFITNHICTHFMHVFLLTKCRIWITISISTCWWKHTKAPKIVITNKKIYNYFWIEYGHYILDDFSSFKIYLISFRLNLVKFFFFKCWKIWTYWIYLWQNNITKFENLHIYFKIKVVSESFGQFFLWLMVLIYIN